MVAQQRGHLYSPRLGTAVACIENIDASTALIDALGQSKALNVFRLDGEQWKMLHHHAAPLEADITPGLSFSSS